MPVHSNTLKIGPQKIGCETEMLWPSSKVMPRSPRKAELKGNPVPPAGFVSLEMLTVQVPAATSGLPASWSAIVLTVKSAALATWPCARKISAAARARKQKSATGFWNARPLRIAVVIPHPLSQERRTAALSPGRLTRYDRTACIILLLQSKSTGQP